MEVISPVMRFISCQHYGGLFSDIDSLDISVDISLSLLKIFLKIFPLS